MNPAPRRRLVVPEVLQTSATDCGPACLQALLAGHGLPASYGRLREACRTDVDGTSIDTLEAVARQLGLEAEQVVLPPDHLPSAAAAALPAIVVVVGEDGITHFVVAWRRHGRWLQVMDPASGRRWVPLPRFLSELYLHRMAVPRGAFETWAATAAFRGAVRERLRRLGAGAAARRLEREAFAATGWRGPAALDAAARTVSALVGAGAIRRGAEAARLLARLSAEARDDPAVLPAGDRAVHPVPDDPERLHLRGAVLVRVRGLRQGRAGAPGPDDEDAPRPLASASVAAVTTPEPDPGRRLLELWAGEGRGRLAAWAAGVCLAALAVTVEALLFRGLLDLGLLLGPGPTRLGAWLAVLLFVAAGLALALRLALDARGFGRRIEGAFRRALRAKLPGVEDRYFRSRPVSDMAERAHALHRLREAPELVRRLVQTLAETLFTTAGMVWIHPERGWLTTAAALAAVGLPALGRPVATERDLKVRSLLGALARSYREAMVGLTAIRSHGAERPVRREHERLLAEWVRASVAALRWQVGLDAVQATATLGAVAWVLVDHVSSHPTPGGALLLAYWGLELPLRGRRLVERTRELAEERNVARRAGELLDAPERPAGGEVPAATGDGDPPPGMAIAFGGVTIERAGQTVLEAVDLELAPGEHVAVVGPSGAGKSTLVGVLLGWHPPARGEVSIDGRPLGGLCLEHLRREVAWVDPEVRLWNRSLLRNLTYGSDDHTTRGLAAVLDQAALREALERLPQGLRTDLGEAGGLLSGGEGQRVRLARALLRPGVRLALLDEPFRGLGRHRRRELLAVARRLWRGVTLLCVTHDVADTDDFDRVLVVSGGRIVEDGDPARLGSDPASAYARLVAADREARARLRSRHAWRRWHLEAGRLAERSGER